MRSIIFILLASFCLGCNSAKHAVTKSNKLNGTWIPVKEEMGGTQLPAAAFKGQQLIIKDSTYQFTAESVDKGIVRSANGKMDIYGEEGVNIGKHFMAIYTYENDQLTICYNLKGDGYPDTFETKGKRLFFLCTFMRDKK